MSNDLIESFSGIRGIYGQGITEGLLKKYIFAYFAVFPQSNDKFLVAGDTRPSIQGLKIAAIDCLKQIGVKEILDAGIIPIQAAELAIQKLDCSGGIYISASHNEPEYNGWKMLKQDGAIVYAEQAEKIINLAHSQAEALQHPTSGQYPDVGCRGSQVFDLYCDYVLEKLGEEAVEKIKKASLRVLFDPNGGSSIEILKQLSVALNLRAEFVNDKPGVFGRVVEPKNESLAYLEKYFTNNDYEFAAGFDCDADRVEYMLSPNTAFAKERGSLVNGNYVLALACDGLLQGTQNQVVVTNDVTSYLVRDVIKKHQASIKEVEVGETIIVQEMEKQNSLIGGEGSNGGVIIPPIKCRDGIMTTALFLKAIATQGRGLGDILKEYPAYYSSHNKAACQPEQALKIKNELENYYRGKGYIIKKTGDETGGLKADIDNNSYIWFRLSKTEPGAFRIYAETDTSQQKADTLAQEAISLFKSFE